MTTTLSEEYLQARAESCKLLGLNPDDLTPFEAIRCDVLTCLRLWLDSGQGQLLAGGNVDPAKLLAVSEALTKFVPAESEHKSRHDDPRQHMWRTYLEMRRRGELAVPESTYEGRGRRIAELEAEVAALKAVAPETNWRAAPDEPGASGSGSTAAITPPACDIVPPGERAECDTGPRPGPDDPPRRSSQVIEGKVNPTPAATPAPAYDYNKERRWRDYVLPDGNISPTPFGSGGKWWGPV